MAMLEKSTHTINLGTSNAAAPTLLAASATVTRWIRGFVITANAAGTWNLGFHTAAIMTAANSDWFGISIAAGATFTHFFPGRGLRLASTDAIDAFASVANMTLTVTYTEQDLT